MVAKKVEAPAVVEPVASKPPKKPKKKTSKKGLRLGVTLSGVAVAVAGGGILGWGAYEEMRFSDSAYPRDQFSSDSDREAAIRADAARVNRLYGVGYGLIGLGVVTSSVGLFAIPVSDGGGVGLRGRW